MSFETFSVNGKFLIPLRMGLSNQEWNQSLFLVSNEITAASASLS